MTDVKQNKLPAIIVDYIDKIRNPNLPDHTKDFYIRNLEHIRDACSNAIDFYYKSKSKRQFKK